MIIAVIISGFFLFIPLFYLYTVLALVKQLLGQKPKNIFDMLAQYASHKSFLNLLTLK
jgi:hypothetical protein